MWMAAACLLSGCVHAPWQYPPPEYADDQTDCPPDQANPKKSHVHFRKFSLACFHVPLYQLPDGYSSTYRQHLEARELSPVLLGKSKGSSNVRLASASESKPRRRQDDNSDSESNEPAESAD